MTPDQQVALVNDLDAEMPDGVDERAHWLAATARTAEALGDEPLRRAAHGSLLRYAAKSGVLRGRKFAIACPDGSIWEDDHVEVPESLERMRRIADNLHACSLAEHMIVPVPDIPAQREMQLHTA